MYFKYLSIINILKKYNNLNQMKLKIFLKIDIDLFSILVKNSKKYHV